MTLQNRIAGAFALVTSLSIALILGVIYLLFRQYTHNEFRQRMEERANVAAQVMLEQDELSQRLLEQLARKQMQSLPEEESYIIRLDVDPHHYDTLSPEYINGNLLIRVRDGGYHLFSVGHRMGVGLRYEDNQGIFASVLIAYDQYGHQKLNNLRQVMLLSLVVYGVMVLFIGRAYARQALRPISGIIRQMEEINSRSLHLRLPVDASPPDELGELSLTFNQMLDRIETALETQSHFIGNASHQLKTPLTAILGKVEMLLAQPRSAEEYQQNLGLIGQEAERLRQLIMQLFQLVHTGNKEEEAFVEFRIDELLFELCDSYNSLEQGRVRFDFNHSRLPADPDLLLVRGHRRLLRIAISNLIENGLKFSQPPEVRIALRAEERQISVEIHDKGIGIPAAQIEHIFHPFFRAENVRAFPGFGMGLALVQRVVRLHNGKVSVSSQPGQGSVFTIVLAASV